MLGKFMVLNKKSKDSFQKLHSLPTVRVNLICMQETVTNVRTSFLSILLLLVEPAAWLSLRCSDWCIRHLASAAVRTERIDWKQIKRNSQVKIDLTFTFSFMNFATFTKRFAQYYWLFLCFEIRKFFGKLSYHYLMLLNMAKITFRQSSGRNMFKQNWKLYECS